MHSSLLKVFWINRDATQNLEVICLPFRTIIIILLFNKNILTVVDQTHKNLSTNTTTVIYFRVLFTMETCWANGNLLDCCYVMSSCWSLSLLWLLFPHLPSRCHVMRPCPSDHFWLDNGWIFDPSYVHSSSSPWKLWTVCVNS